MKDTPIAYHVLRNAIENTKRFLPSLRQIDIDRIFTAAKPHDMTKLSIHVAKQLYYNNQDDTALSVLSAAKFALMHAVYRDYAVFKTYCIDKLEACEKEILKNRIYHTNTQPITTPANQSIQYASANRPISYQPSRSNSDNDSTWLMNQVMMATLANQVMVANGNCRDEKSEQPCPSSYSNEHHHHHHDDSSYSSTYTSNPYSSQDASSNYHSSNTHDTHHSHQPDYSSSHNDSNSMYHGSSTLFDNSSHHNHGTSSHDYSSSSHDISSNNDHSSNSYSM